VTDQTAPVPDLPVIDLAPLIRAGDGGSNAADVADVAGQIDRACRSTGFFLVSGHGVDPTLLPRLDESARTFFALPEPEKEAVAMAHGGRAWRGWFPLDGELTAGRPDHKEGFYFGVELPADDPRVLAGLPLHGPNLFPTQVPELRPLVLAWMGAMTRLGRVLASGVALGLGLDAGWFERNLTAEPTTLFRIFRYPPSAGAGDPGWGVAEHTDYGLLTILAHDGRPGLEVRGPDGWIEVPAVPDTFVVNLGDMLDRMTAGRYRSTPHRVRPVPGNRDRLSFPFFFDPGWDVEIAALPLDGQPPPDDADDRWDASSVHQWHGTYGEYLTAKVAKVFPALGADVLER
jgi:isopenicillin N synthase-like dioxygenase